MDPLPPDVAITPSALTQCCVCLDEHESHLIFNVPDHPVCHPCLIQLFHRALDSEENYPPTLGPHVLEIRLSSLRALLEPQLLAAYREKEREYRCPLAKRLFCAWPKVLAISVLREGNDRCNTFLGQSVEKPSDVLSFGTELVAKCSKCHRFSCRACGERIEDPDTARDHKCIPLSAADAEHEAFAGLRRGKDFQICPSERCGRRVELSSGCNHITCYCKQQFCFLCGEPAGASSYHWEQRADGTAGCPRYNQPDSANAIFDHNDDMDLAPDDHIMNAGHLIQPRLLDGIALANVRNLAQADMNADHGQRIEPFARLQAERERLRTQMEEALDRERLMMNHRHAVLALNNQGNVVERVYRPPRMRYDPVRDGPPRPPGNRRQDGQRRRPHTGNDQGEQVFADGESALQREGELAPAGAHNRATFENSMRQRESQRLDLNQRFAEQRRAWADMTARTERAIAERDAAHQFPTFPAAPPAANNALPGAHNNDADALQFDYIANRRHARVFPDPVPPPGFYDDNGAFNHPQPLESNPVNELNPFQPQGFDNRDYNHPHPLQSNPTTEPSPYQPQSLMANSPAFDASQRQHNLEHVMQLHTTGAQTRNNGSQQHPLRMINPFVRLNGSPHTALHSPLRSTRGPAAPTAENFPTVPFDSTDSQANFQARTPNPATGALGAAHDRGMPRMRSIFSGVQNGLGFGTHPHDSRLSPMREAAEVAPARDNEPGRLTPETNRRRRRAAPVSPGFPTQTSQSTSNSAGTVATLTPRNSRLVHQRQRALMLRSDRGTPGPTDASGTPSPESDRGPYQTGSTEETAHSGYGP